MTRCIVIALLASGPLPGCGAGVVGIVALLSNDSSSSGRPSNQSPVVDFDVVDTRTSPARLDLLLSDREGNPADLTITFIDPATRKESDVKLVGTETTTQDLETSREGVRHQRFWDFASQVSSGERFQSDVEVRVKVGDALPKTELVDLGNDPPVLTVGSPAPAEVVGIVDVGFSVADSSGDLVSVVVEYAVVDDREAEAGRGKYCPDVSETCNLLARSGVDSDLRWNVARSAGLEEDECTPTFAFRTFQAPAGTGSDQDFFWDVLADLGRTERTVRLRLTPCDGDLWGESVEIGDFRVDNNQAPIVVLDVESFLLNPDRRRGIPVPFRVSDEEDDPVRVVFQWRRAEQSFDDDRFTLPMSRQSIEEILADPSERRRRQIATERPVARTGTAFPAAAERERRVRLFRPTDSEPRLLSGELKGRQIEILRLPNTLRLAGEDWDLTSPVTVLPRGDGTLAVVLDSPTPGSWRLREILLASGEVAGVLVASRRGTPTAAALESTDLAILVALHQEGDGWSIARVDEASGDVSIVASARDVAGLEAISRGPLRGISSLGTGAVLATVADTLARVSFLAGSNVRFATILDGLASPRGVVRDPLRPNRAYVAERDWQGAETVGRVLEIRLDTLDRRPVVAKGIGLPRPTVLALEHSGARLLAITDFDPDDGSRELRGVELGVGSGDAFEVYAGLPGQVAGLATGADSLRVVTLKTTGQLALGGGVEQRRSITDFDAAVQEAVVEPPLDPALEDRRLWRVLEPLGLVTGESSRTVFVWDSDDVLPRGGDAVLRAVPYDSQRGIPSSTGAPREMWPPIQSESIFLGGGAETLGPAAVALGDLDGDGDLDIASANRVSGTITVFFQNRPGEFPVRPDLVLGDSTSVRGPVALELADIDGDGALDIASANESGNDLALFFQGRAGEFPRQPSGTLGSIGSTNNPVSIAIADLNRDGRLDVLSANRGRDNYTLFFQEETGIFGLRRRTLGSASTTSIPRSVAAGDVDGDGATDIVATSGSGVHFFYQREAGEFPLIPDLTLASDVLDPRDVALADLDGDADLDVVITSEIDFIAVFLQGPPRGFSVEPSQILDAPGSPRGVQPGDLDGDGKLDIVSADPDGETVSVFFQRSTGRFEAESDLRLVGPQGPRSIDLGDVDGDGDLDMVSADFLGRGLTVLFQRSSAIFPEEPSVVLEGATESLEVVDLDGDGDLDFISGRIVRLQTQPGVYPADPDVELAGLAAEHALAGDIDDDGDLDLLTANPNHMEIHLQRGPGDFSEQADIVLGEFDATPRPSSISLVDIDGDGRLDVVSANTGVVGRPDEEFPGSITIFFQSVEASFPFSPDVTLRRSLGFHPTRIVAAHLNRDERLDLVAADPNGLAAVVVFLQAETGGFRAEGTDLLGPGSTSRDIAVVDLDGDGDNDLVSENGVYYQDGTGNFPVDPNPSLEIGAPLRAVDLDGDGRLDIIAIHDETLRVLLQQASGEFVVHGLGGPESTTGLRSVDVGDLDGDGDLDLVTANSGSVIGGLSGNLAVFLQWRPGEFLPSPDILAGESDTTNGPSAVRAVDVDGDGDTDLVSANRRGNTLTIFYGSH